MPGFCEVALPVPLRTTFTYRVPDALDELVVPGARVVVPFRNRAMIGVVLEASQNTAQQAPPGHRRLNSLDVAGRSWMRLRRCRLDCSSSDDGRGLLVAPLGDMFRTMLPPSVSRCLPGMAHQRRRARAPARVAFAGEPQRGGNRRDGFARVVRSRALSCRWRTMRKLLGGEAAAAAPAAARGQIAVHEIARQRRAARTQKIVA